MNGYRFNNGVELDIPDIKGDELVEWLEEQEGDYLYIIDKIRELQNNFYRPIVEC